MRRSHGTVFPSAARAARCALALLAFGAILGCGDQAAEQLPPPPPPPSAPPPPNPPPPPPGPATVTITVDTLQRFQTINGWEATAEIGQTDFVSIPWANEVAQLAVGLGINRLRMEIRSGAENPLDNFLLHRNGQISDAEWRTRRYQVVNDNGDPGVLDPNGVHFTELDLGIEKVVLPVRAALAAQGESLYLNLDYVGFNNDAAGVHLVPAEYAEFMLAVFQHLQAKYGLVPDAVEMILEPDNGTAWNGTKIGLAMVATAARLAAAGFHPDFIAPSTTSMAAAATYFDAIAAVTGALGVVDEISFHRYAGVSDAALSAIAQRGALYGLRTAMLEHLGSGADDLYKDLTVGQVSAWQQFGLAYPSASDNGSVYFLIQGNHPVAASRTGQLRQYFRYVRSGAVRVRATSDKASIRSVGFVNVGGGPVVVIHASGTETYGVVGLRPGRYLVTSSDVAQATIGTVTVGSDGELRLALTLSGVVTIAFVP